MLEITDTGLVIERLDEILARLTQGMRDIYGSNINVSPDTPDGQMIGIFAQSIADINEIIAGVYAFSDPTKAVGTWLDIQLKYVGIERNKQSYSRINKVTIISNNSAKIEVGYVAIDKNGVEWVAESNSIGSSVTFRSKEYGNFSAKVGDKLTPKTIVLGITDLIVGADSEAGRLQESDESALMRFLRSYGVNNIHDREGIEAGVLAIDGVSDVKVYENYTNEKDALGIDPHTINVVVDGGNAQSIAKAILDRKPLGVGMHGNTTVTVNYQGADRTALYSRAGRISIKVKVTVVRKSSLYDVDKDYIKNTIAANSFRIAENVIAGQLYNGIMSNNFTVKSIILSSDRYSDVLELPIGARDKGYITANNVEVIVE